MKTLLILSLIISLTACTNSRESPQELVPLNSMSLETESAIEPISTPPNPEPFNEPLVMNQETPVPTEPEPQCTVFDDFSGDQSVFWQTVNDNVMGGRSIGDFVYENQTLILSGSINLNGGGFTSVRAPLARGILEPYNAIKITAKTDGRGYAITFRDSNRQRLSHRLPLNLKASPDWQETTILFADLQPAFFGEVVRAAGFVKAEAREIGIILNDGAGGDYNLVIDKIELCNVSPK